MSWLNWVPFWVLAIVFLFGMSLIFRFLGKVLPTPKKKPKPLSQAPASNRGCLVFFGGIFCLMGLAALFLMTIRPAYRAVIARNWRTTNGTVISSRLNVSHGGKGGSSYSIDIHYSYSVAGAKYEGSHYDGTSGSDSFYHDAKLAIVQAHHRGASVTVYYNPNDPADSLLSTALPPGTFTLSWIPLIFVAVGLLIVGAAFYKRRNVMISADAPATLSMRSRRIGAFAVTLFFTLVWCGISIALVKASDAPIYFKIVFPLVGVGLLIATGYRTLSLFNPRIAIDFDRLPLQPGQAVVAAYRVSGNFLAIRSLTIALEGRESATHQAGKQTNTSTHVAWRFPLLDTTQPADMERGTLKIVLPADAMPTFIAANNRFTWHLVCLGDIPNRPNIKDEFAVPVAAKGRS